jgi:protein-disulfide isomerase-like protein with CxxC motif
VVQLEVGGLNEKQLQQAVIETAHVYKWRVAHFRPARVMRGGKEIYETPVAADGKGFPDLVLVRNGKMMFIELKSRNGRTSPQQDDWLKDLTEVSNTAYDGVVEVYVWRPADWESGLIPRRLK